MLNKISKIILGLLLFTMIWATVSSTFDGDLGWHLRFGKDAWQGNFQYTDSYTWGFYGQNWFNHEWGGDILFWSLYHNFTYYSLVILITLIVFLAFFLTEKLINGKTTNIGLIISVIAFMGGGHIVVMRLAMFATLFFLLIWWTLEKIPTRKLYWLWPIILWLWSALHGSWILGFITINIYFGGHLLQNIIHHFYPSYPSSLWNKKTFINVIYAQIASFLVIIINPYSYKIITEIFSYFSQNFYKAHISEWIPSYTFPVFWIPLIISAIILYLAIHLFWYKKINLAQFLLILAFSISAFLYKRNALFIVLIGIPLLAKVTSYVIEKIKTAQPKLAEIFFSQKNKNILYILSLTLTIIFIFFQIKNIKIYKDIWDQETILTGRNVPYQAVEFLKKANKKTPSKIFNEFSWGAYLNWTMPESLVFFDGRGTATWPSLENPGKTMLEDYFAIKFESGGLEKLDQFDLDYVILQKDTFIGYAKPDMVNQILFGQKLKQVYKKDTSQLEIDLNKSKNWQLIYTDGMANIWKRVK